MVNMEFHNITASATDFLRCNCRYVVYQGITETSCGLHSSFQQIFEIPIIVSQILDAVSVRFAHSKDPWLSPKNKY